MAEDADEPRERFERVSGKDSKSIFKPGVVALVVTDGDENGPNVMTAAWWMVAGYRPFRYMLAVSHHTYTYDVIEENPEFVMAAPSTGMIDALTLCGAVSGRDVDKIDHLGLETVPGEAVDVPLLADAVGNVECRVEDSFSVEGTTYYLAGVEAAHVQRGLLDGRVLSAEADPLAYMGSDRVDEDDEVKHRYYLEFDDEDLRAYPGEEVLETLPDEVRD